MSRRSIVQRAKKEENIIRLFDIVLFALPEHWTFSLVRVLDVAGVIARVIFHCRPLDNCNALDFLAIAHRHLRVSKANETIDECS